MKETLRRGTTVTSSFNEISMDQQASGHIKTTLTPFSPTRIGYRPFKQRENAHFSLYEGK
jgi:hypothetical protein